MVSTVSYLCKYNYHWRGIFWEPELPVPTQQWQKKKKKGKEKLPLLVLFPKRWVSRLPGHTLQRGLCCRIIHSFNKQWLSSFSVPGAGQTAVAAALSGLTSKVEGGLQQTKTQQNVQEQVTWGCWKPEWDKMMTRRRARPTQTMLSSPQRLGEAAARQRPRNTMLQAEETAQILSREQAGTGQITQGCGKEPTFFFWVQQRDLITRMKWADLQFKSEIRIDSNEATVKIWHNQVSLNLETRWY